MTLVFYPKRQLDESTDFQEVTNAGSRSYKATLNSLSPYGPNARRNWRGGRVSVRLIC
jgi:hypothetical protein